MAADKFGGSLQSMLIGIVPSNGWLLFGPMQVYVRCSPRYIQRQRVQCVQLANLVTPEEYQRVGLFTHLVETVKNVAPTLPIVVELAFPEFAEALVRRGWIVINTEDGTRAKTLIDRMPA